MSTHRILIESARLLLAQRVFTLLIAAISALGVFAGIASSGQGIANEQAILSTIDDIDTTTISIKDTDGNAHLNDDTVARIAALSSVEWAIGLGPSRDAGNARLKSIEGTPIKRIVGASPAINMSAIRSDGVALSSQSITSLHFSLPGGAVRRSDTAEFPVVGQFSAQAPLEFLSNFALLIDSDDPEPLVEIILSTTEPGAVSSIVDVLDDMVGLTPVPSITITAPEVLNQVRDLVSGDLRKQGQQAILYVLAITTIMTAVVAFAAVSARRRDYGRRRALGARRTNLVVLILAHMSYASGLGSSVGLAAGAVTVRNMTSMPADLRYMAAVAVLTIATTAIAGFVPALIAALRDPLTVLRSL